MIEQARSGHPVFTVIGGPNGAGKSTYTDRLAAAGYDLGEVVNPDVIAAALPGPDATRDARAGRETLHRTRALIASGQTFSRETTLSGSEILRTMQAAKDAGFRVNLFFVGVDSLETSRRRVEDRVSEGGHGIPWQVQERRFGRSFDNAVRAARIADTTVFVHSRDKAFQSVGMARRGVMAWRVDMPGLQWLDRVTEGLARSASMGHRRSGGDIGHGRT